MIGITETGWELESESKRWLPKTKEGRHVAKMGASRGFSLSVAPVFGFSRGMTGSSGYNNVSLKYSPSPTLFNVIIGLHFLEDEILIKALIIGFKFQYNIHFAEK